MIQNSPRDHAIDPLEEHQANNIPRWPLGWYVVSRSRDISSGEIHAGEIGGRPYVLFRTKDGKLHALDAHCPHMGAHLVHGDLVDDTIRCPLHHWRLDVHGRATGSGATCERNRVWPVEEKFGVIFLYSGDGEPTAVPSPADPDDYVWTSTKPVELAADWHALIVNGFDLLHLHAVHHRQLIEPATFAHTSDRRLELCYRSRVTGRSASDLIMKWLSRDCIRVRLTCHGTIVVVETDLGHTKTSAILGVHDTDKGVRAHAAFGIQAGPLSALRLAITRRLFTAFLRRDFKILEGMQLNLDVEDRGVQEIRDFLGSLPGDEQ